MATRCWAALDCWPLLGDGRTFAKMCCPSRQVCDADAHGLKRVAVKPRSIMAVDKAASLGNNSPTRSPNTFVAQRADHHCRAMRWNRRRLRFGSPPTFETEPQKSRPGKEKRSHNSPEKRWRNGLPHLERRDHRARRRSIVMRGTPHLLFDCERSKFDRRQRRVGRAGCGEMLYATTHATRCA